MWEFMKNKKPLQPVCQMQPVNAQIEQLERKRRYILEELDCTYKRILKELSVTDPESLTKLSEVIEEYKVVEESIANKIAMIQEEFDAFMAAYAGNTLVSKYDAKTMSLNLTIERGE